MIPKTLFLGYEPQDVFVGGSSTGVTSTFAITDISGSIVNRNDLFLGDPYSRTNFRFDDYKKPTNASGNDQDYGRIYGSIYFANSNNNLSGQSTRDIQSLTSSDFKYTGIVKRQLLYEANYGSELLLYNYKYPQNTQLQDANNNSPYFNSGDRIRLFGGAIRFDTYNIELEPDNANNHFNDQMYTRMIIDGSGNVGIGSKFQSMNNPSVILEIDSTDAIRLPVGDTNDRPAVTNNGYIRFNSDSSKFEGYNGTTLG